MGKRESEGYNFLFSFAEAARPGLAPTCLKIPNRNLPIENRQSTTPGAYQEALQIPEAAFADPELQAATPDETTLGLPRPVTGAFAAVFPMTLSSGGRVAVKCFLHETPDRRKRYEALRRHFSEADLPYTVGFEYQSEGITVDGQSLPILKMDWAEGQPLNRYVEDHLDAPRSLAALADRFAAMLEALKDHSIAHGDLQHGNVLVHEREDDLALRLVDYDTTYVPALNNKRSAEVGHRNYQHPDRDERDFGPHLDHFAGRVIYTALQVLRRDPALWDRFDTGENLLFQADDFYDPDASPLFEALAQIDAVRPHAEALRTACYLEPEDVPPLAEAVTSEAMPVKRERQRERSGETAAPRRNRTEQLFLPALAACLAGCLALGALIGLAVGVAAGLVVLAAGGIAAWRVWRRLPVVRRRRRLRSELGYFERVIADHRSQIEKREEQRREVKSNVEELRAERLEELQSHALRDRLKYHFVNEAKTVEGIGHRVVVRLKAAGIRAAHQITPDRLAGVSRIGDRSRARVRMWRNSLAREYEDDVPDQLSPAEKRRLRRSVERRAEGFADDIERLRAKIKVQEEERKAVKERLERVPHVTFGRYLAYLMRLRRYEAGRL
jgi:predicted flap endonuclease-1-like 5' DNA nuclease